MEKRDTLSTYLCTRIHTRARPLESHTFNSSIYIYAATRARCNIHWRAPSSLRSRTLYPRLGQTSRNRRLSVLDRMRDANAIKGSNVDAAFCRVCKIGRHFTGYYVQRFARELVEQVGRYWWVIIRNKLINFFWFFEQIFIYSFIYSRSMILFQHIILFFV